MTLLVGLRYLPIKICMGPWGWPKISHPEFTAKNGEVTCGSRANSNFGMETLKCCPHYNMKDNDTEEYRPFKTRVMGSSPIHSTNF